MPYEPKSDFKTSKGNVAPDFHWNGSDDTYRDRDQIKNLIERDYRPAQVLSPATRTYNCHGYAHANSHAWFNEIKQFLEDDYEPFTPGRLRIGDIVVYVKDNAVTHSAVIHELNNNVIVKLKSKWGAWSEVMHGKNNVPAVYGDIVYYLRKRGTFLDMEAKEIKIEKHKKIEKLIYSLTSKEKINELLLANTYETAENIISKSSQITELKLYGDIAGEILTEHLRKSDYEASILLTVALKYLDYKKALPVISQKLLELNNESNYTINEYLLLKSFDSLSREDKHDYIAFKEKCIELAKTFK
ncbi:DUF7689 domain-containing protein [Bacillus cereus]|uniref:DUF7689 domain-containing protein n=1 Tax=Bacillus cereus TaxID=1396 RepID=UPI00217D7876|nr:hypothetical protein [Bacillus cereus]MCS6595297.1 hypothetical protein [Bacillus cereus]